MAAGLVTGAATAYVTELHHDRKRGSLIATFAHGPAGMYGLIAVGLFTSIMFPTIFALAIRGLGPLTEEGSGLLILSIAGGALVFINGKVADNFGIHWAFLITAACELFVLFYALWGSRPTQALPDEQLTAVE
jgi:FHS family L-fucose permease-like MFS transporter